MTRRERVLRCLDFDRPDRIPRDLWILPVAWIEHDNDALNAFCRRWPSDIEMACGPTPAVDALCCGDPYSPGEYRDEWGCVFQNIKPGVIGEVKKPLIESWDDLDKLRLPVECLDIDREMVRAKRKSSDAFLTSGCCPRPFERLQFLRGSANVLADLGEQRPELFELLGRIHGHFVKEMEAWAQTEVDSLNFMDDWGSQRSLLISPAMWRKHFKPLYAEYARIAHDAGKKVFMHSDGHIQAIYADLVEIGIDAVNSQLFCMDIEEIGRLYRGKITFWGEIDRQGILPRGSVEDAREAVRRVVDALYQPEGGVIAQFELSTGSRLDNADAIFSAWQEFTGSPALVPAAA